MRNDWKPVIYQVSPRSTADFTLFCHNSQSWLDDGKCCYVLATLWHRWWLSSLGVFFMVWSWRWRMLRVTTRINHRTSRRQDDQESDNFPCVLTAPIIKYKHARGYRRDSAVWLCPYYSRHQYTHARGYRSWYCAAHKKMTTSFSSEDYYSESWIGLPA